MGWLSSSLSLEYEEGESLPHFFGLLKTLLQLLVVSLQTWPSLMPISSGCGAVYAVGSKCCIKEAALSHYSSSQEEGNP
eukprot:12734192-Ditylum_brightwellii.AAC.1